MNSKSFLPEWYTQSTILLTWPHLESDWSDDMELIEKTYLALSIAIAEFDNLTILAYNMQHKEHIKEVLKSNKANISNINIITVPTNDTWIRDYGHISIAADNKVSYINFNFNGYGEKYSFDLDNQVNIALLEEGIINSIQDNELIIEGGSIETDGNGTILTTESCLLNPNRNGLSNVTLTKALEAEFGNCDIIYLTDTYLEGDDTDGHIDNFVRFIDSKTILYLDMPSLKEQLQKIKNFNNKPYELVAIPLSSYQIESSLPATYLNFLITNTKILVPIFNCETDDIALKIIAEYSGNREVEGIDCRNLVSQGGGIHCSTMQIARD